MERRGDEVHAKTDEARGGSTPHIVRYVLLISLCLAILAMSEIWISGAASMERDSRGDVPKVATPAR
jgi:hypothetical protein